MTINFVQAMDQRDKENIKSELTFIGIKESKLEKYEKIKNEIFASVKFVSEIISVKKDKDNKIIEGNPDKIKTVTDYWKFSRNALSKSPNWYLSEILGK
jgi:predicted lipid-binding transport protein (Tim44 family)